MFNYESKIAKRNGWRSEQYAGDDQTGTEDAGGNAEAQAELEEKEYKVTVGVGAVEAVVSGKKELVSLTLKPEVVDPEDIEMLQDLIISAVNEGLRQVEDESNEQMQHITGGMNIPGLF